MARCEIMVPQIRSAAGWLSGRVAMADRKDLSDPCGRAEHDLDDLSELAVSGFRPEVPRSCSHAVMSARTAFASVAVKAVGVRLGRCSRATASIGLRGTTRDGPPDRRRAGGPSWRAWPRHGTSGRAA